MTKYDYNLPHLRLPPPVTVSLFKPPKERFVELGERDLIALWKSGILSTDAYILLGINASFGQKKPSIHISSFCELWELEREDFLKSAAVLKKLGIEFDLVPEPKPGDVVLGGNDNKSQPRPDDAVLGGD
ncbi:MAG: hypothetical protein F6K14_11715 [Symploca sp. SIO2C1]|nr:hypothetical protein [Symploca sp. SIO2C1]